VYEKILSYLNRVRTPCLSLFHKEPDEVFRDDNKVHCDTPQQFRFVTLADDSHDCGEQGR
jgi:hypothetical protein